MPFDSEWVIWEKVAQETNIHLEGVIAKSNASEEEAFNLMLSSGELADVIGYSSSADLEKLGRDGGLLALNDLIKEHAPNIQKKCLIQTRNSNKVLHLLMEIFTLYLKTNHLCQLSSSGFVKTG